jgi:hypothetical protein
LVPTATWLYSASESPGILRFIVFLDYSTQKQQGSPQSIHSLPPAMASELFLRSFSDLTEEVDDILEYVKQGRSHWSEALLSSANRTARLEKLVYESQTACHSLRECINFEDAGTMTESARAIIDGQSITVRGGFLLRAHILFSRLEAVVRNTSHGDSLEYSTELGEKFSNLKDIWDTMLQESFPDFQPNSTSAEGSIIDIVDGKVTLSEGTPTNRVWTIDVSPLKDSSIALDTLLKGSMEYQVSEHSRRGTITLKAYSVVPPDRSEIYPADFPDGWKSTPFPGMRKRAFSVKAARRSLFAESLRRSVPTASSNDNSTPNVSTLPGSTVFPSVKLR